MANAVSERLSRLNNKIMAAWEKRAIQEVEAAIPKNSLALRDSLPEFLEFIASALNTEIDRTKLTKIGKKHGRERAHEANYTIDQLIHEYSILRKVLCEVMEQEAPLSPEDREIIVCAIEQAVNDAATEYSETFSDIQEKFTNTLAHDLRGPLSSARLAAQLISKKPDDATSSTKLARQIVTSMDRIDLMIHDLLDGSKLRSGELLSLVLEDCDLDAILLQVADDKRMESPSRIDYRSIGPVNGRWNANGLQRVLDNLLSNALKFSPPESVVTVELRKIENAVEILVQNFGTPIRQEELEGLFRRFHRAKNAEGKSGWGLGLTVVKGITEAHGGKVEVESSADYGTIFKVTLPLVESGNIS